MKRYIIIVLALWLSMGLVIQAQGQEPYPVNGVKDHRIQRYAFTNANIFIDYQTQLQGASLLIEEGRVVAVGRNIQIPAGTIREDLNGLWIYPAFIDPYTNYGVAESAKKSRHRYDPPQDRSETAGAFGWNEAIKAEYNAADEFSMKSDAGKPWREQGFGAALAHRKDGIARGTGVLVSLTEDEDQRVVLVPRAAALFSFDKGSSQQEYPGSLMGAIALLRQTQLDARWYTSQSPRPFTDQSLEAIHAQREMPQIFEVSDMLSALRADKVGDEFGIQYIIKGAGDEYQRLEEIAQTGATFILPLNFPKAYDVEDPIDEMNVSLQDMKHWEMAPFNPALLAERGVEFAFTTDGLEDKGQFLPHVRKAVQHGLDKQKALKALTHTPARLLNAENMLGSLREGRKANFIICSGDLFEEDTKILQNWIQGKNYRINPMATVDARGEYLLALDGQNYPVKVKGEKGAPVFKLIHQDTLEMNMKASLSENLITLTFNPNPEDTLHTRSVRLSGWKEGRNWKGNGRLADGREVSFRLTYQQELDEDAENGEEGEEGEERGEGNETEDAQNRRQVPERGPLTFPLVAYGYSQAPEPRTYLIRNATVWTNEEDGILENTDVLVSGGKIRQIGQNLAAGDAELIDGTGRHLTSGIIDEHSHIAIQGGVNEATQSVTAEVRIGDVINSEDINIYRQLAGGVTAAQLLHGSANPIGGQSALIKLRWGRAPEQMKIENAPGYIKFALGENVKQANWGPHMTERFPQTRMGVEQVMIDAFGRAQAYEKSLQEYNSLSRRAKQNTLAPRRDLEMETLVEILNKERFITSHSYVQSEINMLMEVAEQFDIRVNTFTHILEGYKLADKMAKHGAGGSTFADWWVYKMEVREAIPYNAALMHGEGIVTAINSDDAEMGRRLNQEAAKTVKYGGVPEEEALKMVTLNPAKLLHLDDRMGSIRTGKDADLVLWNDHPLSVYAKPLKTMVDGVVYYDSEQDEALRRQIQQERGRLITKMRKAMDAGEPTQKVEKKEAHHWHCADRQGFNHRHDR